MDNLDTPHTRTALAVLLIGAGALLFALQLYGGSAGVLWPFFIIVPGATLLILAARTGWHASRLVAGAIVMGVGLILLVQNLYDYYRSWAYAWTLLPMAAGAALFYSGEQRQDMATRARGRSLIQWAAAAFVVLAILFEFLLFDDGQVWGGYLVPLGLIVMGAFMLMRRHPRRHGASETHVAGPDVRQGDANPHAEPLDRSRPMGSENVDSRIADSSSGRERRTRAPDSQVR